MLKNFYLSRPAVQNELNLLKQQINIAKAETIKVRTDFEMSASDKERSMKVSIDNLTAGHTLQKEEILKLEKRMKEYEVIIADKNNKITAIEEMIKVQEKIINESEQAIPDTDKDRQISNLKQKIKDIQIEVEQLKQINFDKNQKINELQHG